MAEQQQNLLLADGDFVKKLEVFQTHVLPLSFLPTVLWGWLVDRLPGTTGSVLSVVFFR